MKLEAVNIQNFRSIKSVTLEESGGFNVIIGKNNAGKSSILLAIDAFFKCLNKGQPIILNPPIGKSIDHHEKLLEEPIAISMFFKLLPLERDKLLQDIVSEAPQVKNAVDSIDPELRLAVTLEVNSSSDFFAYVRKMMLCSPGKSMTTASGVIHNILEINVEAATELANKAKRAKVLQSEIKEIEHFTRDITKRIDEEDWNRLKSDGSFSERASFPFLPMRFRGSSLSNSAIEKIQELIRSSESKSAFHDAASSMTVQMGEEVDSLESEPIQHRVNSFSGQETSVPVYALNLMKRVGEIKVLYLTERREPIGKPEAAQLLELKVRRGGPEKLRAIQETVQALLGVEIDAFRSETTKSSDDPEAELDVDQFLVQVNGAGIREALRLILDYEFGRPNILLVEEPEIHLHPALETSMMRYLKTIGQESQIFITTHSTNFLDTAEMRNVYLASRNGSTSVNLINIGDAEHSIPRELGIRLSSLFMFDRLIFVEGPSDEGVIREWASILKINLAQASVGFVPMGGVRNLAHFATQATINFLCKRRVSILFILDRDEREETEIERLAEQLGNKARLAVLKKREIENYLIVPRAVAEFISLKKKLSGNNDYNPPSIHEIEKSVEKCVDSLKSVAIERRVTRITCLPIYPNRERILTNDSEVHLLDKVRSELSQQKEKLDQLEEKLDEIIKNQAELVEKSWISNKKDLVPGDYLLDEVCKCFEVRFNKGKDSARLASLMQISEIDPEIKYLLKDFTNLT
jgi:putative ATP-dependent endonuclease of OLD family